MQKELKRNLNKMQKTLKKEHSIIESKKEVLEFEQRRIKSSIKELQKDYEGAMSTLRKLNYELIAKGNTEAQVWQEENETNNCIISKILEGYEDDIQLEYQREFEYIDAEYQQLHRERENTTWE